MDVIVERPVRTASQPLSPEDFCDIAPCWQVAWSSDGGLVVTFEGDLTPAQRAAVRLRCISTDAAEEALLTSVAEAYRANRAYLAGSPTAAQVSEQVAALTRQVNALIRLVTREVA